MIKQYGNHRFKIYPEDILQILIDFYNCQSVFDPEVGSGEFLTFETTISDWKWICDLKELKPLAEHYHKLFELSTPVIELETVLLYKDNKLGEFCKYIAEHALKQQVSPIIMMGHPCMTASIFKTLIANLKDRGVVTNIRPSTKFEPLFYGDKIVALLEEVNKLAPGSLTKFEHQDNWISKTGIALNLLFFVSLIIVPIIWQFHWLLFVPLVVGISLMYIGSKFSPSKEVIGGYDTVRDLVLGMEAKMQRSD